MTTIDSELYKKAFRNTENPTIITDENYVIRDVNQACIEFTGYPREELVGKPPLMLFPDSNIYEGLIEQLENDEPWQGYFETETKDGYHIYGRGSAIPLIVDGVKRGYSGIFVDLTERRLFEQTLQIIQRVLRHDLRNEMNLILGQLQTLEPHLPDEESRRLDEMAGVAERLLRRADKARHLEELLIDGFEQPRKSISLKPILDEELEEFRERFPEAELDVDPIPDCEVIANELIGPAVESVLENAVVHNNGDVRVAVTAEERADGVCICIADNGSGIPDEQKQEVFGRREIDQLHHGQGFSLYFVDTVIDVYRGAIEIRDNEWGGATFELVLRKA
jgi:PAS domain S-box-containing protein